jgi:hypothetical protein
MIFSIFFHFFHDSWWVCNGYQMGYVKKQNAPKMPPSVILWCHFNYNFQVCFHLLLGPQVSIHGFVYVLNLIEMLAQVNGGGTLFPWAFNNSFNNHGVRTQLPCGSMTTIDKGAINQLEWYWLKNNWEMWWKHLCSIHR